MSYTDNIKNISQISIDKKNDLGILFIHHKNDELTKYHFYLLKKHNPNATIFPIQDETKEGLECAIKLNDKNIYWNMSCMWYCCDTYFYRFFMSDICQENKCKRYAYVEYDSYVTDDLRNVYDSVWNEDKLCGPYVFDKKSEPNCGWWKDPNTIKTINKYGSNFKDNLLAIDPFCGIFSTYDILMNISEESKNPMFYNIFCDLRIATIAKKINIPVSGVSEKFNKRVRASKVKIEEEPGFYHIVKDLNNAKI